MVLSITELNKKYKICGGLYIIASEEMKKHEVYKVGMSFTNIYKRLDSYQTLLPFGYDICGLMLMRIKTKSEKELIKQCEKWIHSQLNPITLTTRIFKTRVEVFKDTLDEILKVFMLAQAKFTNIGLFSDFQNEKLEFDDKLYIIESILDDKVDELGRNQYLIKWQGHKEPTWEFESNLKGTDKHGDWILEPFKKYLENKKKGLKIKLKITK